MPLKRNTARRSTTRVVRRIQGIVGSLLYISRAVNNKPLIGLSTIGAKHANTTEATSAAIDQILDSVATYPNDGIIYCTSDMVLCGHSDAAYLNDTKAYIRAGAYIFLLEDDSVLRLNGPVLTVAQIIKFVVSLDAKAELAGLFVMAKSMLPMRQTIIKMGWSQPKSPIQTDKSTAVGVINNTIVVRHMKSMDMRIWWLRCSEYQEHYCYYWGPGPNNEGYYSTKHPPPL